MSRRTGNRCRWVWVLVTLTATISSCGQTYRPPALAFDDGPTDESYAFRWSEPGDAYLERLRVVHDLDGLVEGAGGDYEKIRRVARWVRGRWEHDGDNVPERSDPASILEAASRGARFRCVEYSIVASGCLNALGIRARVLGLKTADVETRVSGAGHMAVEAYLRDRSKWILVDPQ
jgi:transglutaminase-like putative cysteine protease